MEHKLYRLVFLTAIIFFAVGVQAQRRNARYVEYINKYSDLAVEQMKLHKIPASITLAQGLLESGAGNSQLARKSNNHFGTTCAQFMVRRCSSTIGFSTVSATQEEEPR